MGPNFLSLILESLHISTLDSFNYVFCSERTLQTTEILVSFLFLIIVLFVLLLTFEYLKISKGYSHYLVYADTLIKITDSFDLRLSISIIQVPTWYTNNPNESNSVIDLIFLWVNSEEIDTYSILSDLWSPSNYTSLTVNIIISKEFIQNKW